MNPGPQGPVRIKFVALGDPGAGAEREDLLAVEAARMAEVDGLEGRRMAQLGGVESPLELALLRGPSTRRRRGGRGVRPKPRAAASAVCICWRQASAMAPIFMA